MGDQWRHVAALRHEVNQPKKRATQLTRGICGAASLCSFGAHPGPTPGGPRQHKTTKTKQKERNRPTEGPRSLDARGGESCSNRPRRWFGNIEGLGPAPARIWGDNVFYVTQWPLLGPHWPLLGPYWPRLGPYRTDPVGGGTTPEGVFPVSLGHPWVGRGRLRTAIFLWESTVLGRFRPESCDF